MTAARWPLGAGLIGALASGAGGCLLFTDTVNAPPEVHIEGPMQLHRGEMGAWKAVVTDASQGGLAFSWFWGAACPEDLMNAEASGTQETRGDRQATFSYRTPESGDYCVWVIVRDAEGARSFATTDRIAILERTLIVSGPGQVHSGQPVMFTAGYEQEPEAAARSQFAWAHQPGCDDAERAARGVRAEPGLASFRFERAQRAPFCVAVLATDEYGVARPGRLPVTAVHIAAPRAGIRLMGAEQASIAAAEQSFGVFEDIRLAAAEPGELDPDETVRFAWQLTRPDGGTVDPPACPDARPAGSEVCFAPERPGTYRADVAITDGNGNSSRSPTFDLQVVDRPPCIRNSDPRFSSAPKFFELFDRERVFKVTEVQDDGDPWPAPARASQRAFRWWVRKRVPGLERQPFERRVSATFDSFTIPAREYRPRDLIDVRVEYWDRQDLENPQARDFAGRCRPDDAVCEVVLGTGCYQWITWTVEYL